MAQNTTWGARIRSFQRHALDSMVRSFPSLGLENRAEFFVKLFENHLKSSSRILDIGGGWGFYAAPLEKRGHEVTVLDVVKPGLQRAPVVIYPGGTMPFADKAFDASILVTMLHHTPDPVSIIKEAMRVTSGRLIVIEDLYHHAPGRMWTVLRDQLYNFEFFGHPCNFKKREDWLQVFKSCGLKVVSEQRVYTKLAGLSILNGVFVLE